MFPPEALVFVLLSQAFTLTPIVGQQPIDGESTYQEDLTETELKKWMDGVGRDIQVVFGIYNDATSRWEKVAEDPDVWEIDGQEVDSTVSVAKATDMDGILKVYNNTMSKSEKKSNSISLISSATNYLPFVPNSVTFLLLNHIARGNWFVTYKLSGCDIWIAKPEHFLEPLVIHANANQDSDDPIKRLQYKEELAENALDYFANHNQIAKYNFVYRISSSGGCKDKECDDYWEKFKTKNKYYLYPSTAYAFFYGTLLTEIGGTLEGWEFVLKGELENKKVILLTITCPLKKNGSCLIVHRV